MTSAGRIQARAESDIAAAEAREQAAAREQAKYQALVADQTAKIKAASDEERARVNDDNRQWRRQLTERTRRHTGILTGTLAAYALLLTLLLLWAMRATVATAAEWAARVASVAALAATGAGAGVTWLYDAIPDGWWRLPLTVLAVLLAATAVLALLTWAVIVLRRAVDGLLDRYRESGTLAVHTAVWTTITSACLLLALTACSIAPRAWLHWPTLWLLLTALALTAWHIGGADQLEWTLTRP